MLYGGLSTCASLNDNVLKNITYNLNFNKCVFCQNLLNRKVLLPLLKSWANGHCSEKEQFILCIYKSTLFLCICKVLYFHLFNFPEVKIHCLIKYLFATWFKGLNMIFLFNWFVLSKATSWKLKRKEICS